MNEHNLNIGEIGNTFFNVKKIDFDSDESLLDYDIIFLDIEFISTLFHKEKSTDDRIWISESNQKRFDKRVSEIEEYRDHKRILIIFLPSPQTYQFYAGNYVHGSFENTTFSPEFLFIESIIGDRIDIIPKTKFEVFLKKYHKLLLYKSCFTSKGTIGEAIAKIKNTNKIIASFDDNVIYLPSLKKTDSYDEHFSNMIESFSNDLVNLLVQKKELINVPDWIDSYQVLNENELIIDLEKLNQQKKQLEEIIAIKSEKLLDIQSYKVLLFGTGNVLENKIQEVFEDLGFKILKADSNRDDLIVKYNDNVVIIEIKGVTKSATEEHANQLEKWVSEYFLEYKIRPKGILITNTYREVELSKRTNASFPNQMLHFSERRDHCLITSIQLFGLYIDCMNNPSNKEKIVDKLLNTIGEFEDYKNWNSFITFNS